MVAASTHTLDWASSADVVIIKVVRTELPGQESKNTSGLNFLIIVVCNSSMSSSMNSHCAITQFTEKSPVLASYCNLIVHLYILSNGVEKILYTCKKLSAQCTNTTCGMFWEVTVFLAISCRIFNRMYKIYHFEYWWSVKTWYTVTFCTQQTSKIFF